MLLPKFMTVALWAQRRFADDYLMTTVYTGQPPHDDYTVLEKSELKKKYQVNSFFVCVVLIYC